MIGNIVHTLKQHISTVHWDGIQGTGDLAFMPATHVVTTITLDNQAFITSTMAHIVGEWMAEEVGITGENFSMEEIIILDTVWETATYVAITIEEEATIIIMVRPIRTTAIAASATSNAATSMDHVITNITHRERVLLVQQLLNRITGITLEGVEVTVAQQEAMSQVAHSAPQATALVEVAQHSVVVAQVEVITQTEGVPSEDIDNDIRYNKETLIQSGLNTKH